MLRAGQRWSLMQQGLLRKIFLRSQTSVAVEAEDISKARPPEEIPGPRSLPFIGTLYKYMPFGEYKANRMYPTGLAMMKKYGKLVREELLPGMNILHCFDPDIMQKVSQNEGKKPFRPSIDILWRHRNQRKIPLGLGTSNGEEWLRMRNLLNRQMMRLENVEVFIPAQEEVSEDFVQRMRKLRDARREIPNFAKELYSWSCESIGVVCYDTRLGVLSDSHSDTRGRKLVSLTDETFAGIQQANEVDLLCKKFGMKNIYEKKVFKLLDTNWQMSQELIEEAWERNKTQEGNGGEESEKEKSSVLRSLMSIPNITLDDVHSMVNDLFFAGIESTGSTMGFLLYNLARNPEKQEVLRQEILQAAPPGTKITAEVLRKTPYLRACVRESHRLIATAFGTARVLDKEVVLGGYRVPAGWVILFHGDVMGRLPEYFPEPDSFLPERWLRNYSNIPRHPFGSLPFGFGPRMCIGRRFAEQEIYVLAAKIMQNFRMDYNYEDIHGILRLFNRPDKPVRVSFTDI